MVEKIMITPEKVRGYGNIISPKTGSDFTVSDCTLIVDTDTVNGELVTVYDLQPSTTVLTVVLTVDDNSVLIGETVTLSATVEDEMSDPVSGASVSFKLGGSSIGTSTTNNSGIATYTYTCNTAGTLTFSASCMGNNSNNVNVTVTGHDYSLTFSSTSYTTNSSGDATVSAVLTDNGTAVSGATVTFTGGTSTVTATTNSSGVATATVNFTSSGTLTATSNGVNDTCNITVLTYLFYDACNSASGLSNYGSLVSLESSGTNANMTYDSTENAYAITSLSSGIKCYPITALNGLDDFKLSYEFRTPSTTNNYGLGLAPIIASTHTGTGLFVNKHSGGRETVVHRDKNNSETYWGGGQTITGYDTSKYYKLELVIDGDNATWNLYDGNTLLRTYSYTLSSLSTDYNTLSNRDYGITVGWNNSSSVKMYIKNIKAEAL